MATQVRTIPARPCPVWLLRSAATKAAATTISPARTCYYSARPDKWELSSVGPNLANYGVPNVLADPVLQLFSGQTMIASNDNRGDAANAAAIQATGTAPAYPKESAILITLDPGPYTAIMSGANGATGVGIVEVIVQ